MNTSQCNARTMAKQTVATGIGPLVGVYEGGNRGGSSAARSVYNQ